MSTTKMLVYDGQRSRDNDRTDMEKVMI